MSTQTKKTLSQKTHRMVQIAVLTAIIVVLALTPVGYLRVGIVEITFTMIPVVVGAVLLGPTAGTILGAVFGLTSYIQGFGMSVFGTTCNGIDPAGYVIMCFVPRILMGLAIGWIYRGLSRVDHSKFHFISCGIAGLLGPLTNTVLFMSAFMLFYGTSDYVNNMKQALGAFDVFGFVCAFVGLNGVLEIAVSVVVVVALSPLLQVLRRKFC